MVSPAALGADRGSSAGSRADTPDARVSGGSRECNWWLRKPCPGDLEGLPPEAHRTGVVLTVDTTANVLHLFEDGKLIASSPAATGSNRMLRHGLKAWLFRTPHGRVTVRDKKIDPVWTKPDWAYVEEGLPIPPPDSPGRRVSGKLGRYALDLGDGILIHGTDNPASIGKNSSHGCIRLPDGMLERVFNAVEVGTEVWIY